jgi:hypothetical protein
MNWEFGKKLLCFNRFRQESWKYSDSCSHVFVTLSRMWPSMKLQPFWHTTTHTAKRKKEKLFIYGRRCSEKNKRKVIFLNWAPTADYGDREKSLRKNWTSQYLRTFHATQVENITHCKLTHVTGTHQIKWAQNQFWDSLIMFTVPISNTIYFWSVYDHCLAIYPWVYTVTTKNNVIYMPWEPQISTFPD